VCGGGCKLRVVNCGSGGDFGVDEHPTVTDAYFFITAFFFTAAPY
jgi:hypothetical protein